LLLPLAFLFVLLLTPSFSFLLLVTVALLALTFLFFLQQKLPVSLFLLLSGVIVGFFSSATSCPSNISGPIHVSIWWAGRSLRFLLYVSLNRRL
jgi:hypothetical protein